MNLECTPELGEMRPAIRRFVSERLEPITQQIDATGEVPPQAMAAMQAQGYLGMRLPEAFGGGGFDLSTYCLVMEEWPARIASTR